MMNTSQDRPEDRPPAQDAIMSRRERDDLARLTRQRERLAKAMADVKALAPGHGRGPEGW